MSDTENKGTTERKQRVDNLYQLIYEALKEFRSEVKWVSGAAFVVGLLTYIVRNERARGLLNELMRGALNLASDAGLDETRLQEWRDNLEDGIHDLIHLSAMFGVFVFGLCYALAMWSSLITDAGMRGMVLLPPGVLLTVASILFVRGWALPLVALSAALKAIPGSRQRATVAEKVVRLLGKTNAWIHFGLNVLIIAPFHNSPQLLWMALGVNLIYVGFCNAWERGQSEYVRRTILWMAAWCQGILILLSPYPKAVRWLKLEPASVLDAHFYVPALLFVAVMAVVLFLGTRRTPNDVAYALVAADNSLEGRNIDHLRTVGQLTGVPTGESSRSTQRVVQSSFGPLPIVEGSQLYSAGVKVRPSNWANKLLMATLSLVLVAGLVYLVIYALPALAHNGTSWPNIVPHN